jgi:hypothetical protein
MLPHSLVFQKTLKQHNGITFPGIGIGDFRVFVEDLIHCFKLGAKIGLNFLNHISHLGFSYVKKG